MERNGRGSAPLALVVLAVVVLLGPVAASASTITLPGSGTMSPTYQFLWTAPTSPTISNDYDLAVSGQYAFLDQFTSQQPESLNLGTSSVGAYDFQDSYRFTIGSGASGDSMVASLGLCNGNGCTFEAKQLIEQDVQTGCSVYLPRTEGRLVVQALINAVNGAKQTGTYVNPLQYSPIGGLGTKANIANFQPEFHS